MGYELKMYIGVLSKYEDKIDDDISLPWFNYYAMVDLCKMEQSFNKFVSTYKQYAFIFGSDGDTKIYKDNYGQKLVVIPVNDVMRQFEKMVDHENPYRRITWAWNLLHAMTSSIENSILYCLFLGH